MKISKENFAIVEQRIKNGETFTSIAKEYSCTPWAIQKRTGGSHPVSGKKNCPIWEYVPNFQDICKCLEKKYWNYNFHLDLYDFLCDFATQLSEKNLNRIKRHPKKSGVLYNMLQDRIFDSFLRRKKERSLDIDNNSGHLFF